MLTSHASNYIFDHNGTYIPMLFLSIDFLLKCPSCHGHYSGPQCKNCKHSAFQCAICRVVVKGMYSFYPLISLSFI